jgi:HAD superfamily hydrolase (TIGR01509 family)
MTPSPFKAIIWDCDGVLMDSEYISCELSARTLTQAGYPITTDELVRRFCGQDKKYVQATINAEAGYDVFAKIDDTAKTIEQRRLFTEQLKAINGIEEVLKAVTVPMAIASGSDYDRLHFTLDLIQMRGTFGSHIYSSDDVAHGKPEPDIFLHAADKLGVAPADCLVVEDSLNGVKAGKAAAMTVYGFTGGTHIHDKTAHRMDLLACGADWVFDEMGELLTVLTQPEEPEA